MGRFFFLLLMPLWACAAAAIPSNKDIVQQFYTAVVKQEYKTIDSLMADNYQIIDIGTLRDGVETTSNDINKRTRQLHRAIPGFTIKIDQLVSEGNKVMVRTKLSGAQQGAFMGVAPTNKPIVLRNFVEFTIENGKITKTVELWNELAVMRQMGYIILN